MNEIYYMFDYRSNNLELLKKAIVESEQVWHFVSVITEINLNKKEITLDKIKNLVENTKIIIVGAYDGEAYVFWERGSN